jgi:hypothetical protein
MNKISERGSENFRCLVNVERGFVVGRVIIFIMELEIGLRD